MQDRSDAQLLRDYAENASEGAFREIVGRHGSLVYSAALRQLESTDLARDVAQGVFIDLARKAKALSGTLVRGASLVGWLYQSTRFAVLKLLRNERRRQSRERQAMEQMETLSHTSDSPADWERVRPFLDEAMSNLSEQDRDALLLRFFQNRDFRAVGAALGISDDAAQKRVSRGLARLREELVRHGIKATAGSLAILLSANAIETAPAGVVAAIASSAIVAGSTAATSAAKLILMTTLQKGLVAITVIAAVASAVYQGHQASALRRQNQRLEQAQAPLAEQVKQLAREHEDSTNRLAGLLAEMERLRRESTQDPKLRGDLRRALYELVQLRAGKDVEASPDTTVQDAWNRRVASLKRWFQDHPDKAIPELRLLDEDNWLFTASRNLEVATNDLQKADHNTFAMIASDLRQTAKNRFARTLGHALSGFLTAHTGVLPNSLQELLPYFSRGDTAFLDSGAPIDDSILQRYQLVKTGPISNLAPDEPIIIEKAPVDKQVDSLLQLRLGTFSYKSVGIIDNMAGESQSWAAPDAYSLTAFLKQPRAAVDGGIDRVRP